MTSSPRQRLQSLLSSRWLDAEVLMHHRQVQILPNTLRREKELVSVQLTELLGPISMTGNFAPIDRC